MRKHSITELNQLFEAGKSEDKTAHAEMRSNVLMVGGEHYTKKLSEYFNQRNNRPSEGSKLSITKNWLHRSHRIYVNSIISQAPGVTATPNNPYELQHKKSAELNNSVIQYLKNKYKLRKLHRNLCSDYCAIGEAWVRLRFDTTKGEFRGYEQLEIDGVPQFDEMGAPLSDETKPVMSGAFSFDRIFGHQIFRQAGVMSLDESPFIGVEELVPVKELKERYREDPDTVKGIEKSNENFIIFDTNTSLYGKATEMCSIRNYYFKPCADYPQGYFYVTTKETILEEGPLPKGKFPLKYVGFDENATKVRATSIVKVGKPWQMEINRASSQAALHGITTADDKILTPSGTKLEQGSVLPGVRGLTYSGMQAPTILPGRNGEQFYEYIDRNEAEMNRALMIDMIDQEKMNNLDPFAMIFRSMNQNKNFTLYAEKFGEFMIDFYETALELCKEYLDDEEYIAAVGKSELINIKEFRDTTPLHYKIILEEQEDTVETKLGRHLTMMNLMQYVGNKLEPEDIGKIMENAPFGNWKSTFSRWTQNERNVKNDFLAIERGETPMVSPNDDSKYILAEVAARKKERDFRLLAPEVQDLYQQYEEFHQKKIEQEMQDLKAAEAEFIPTGGALVACDMYVPSSDPNKAPKRVRIPYEALQWLTTTIERQGLSQDNLEQMNQTQVAEILRNMQGYSQLQAPAQVA